MLGTEISDGIFQEKVNTPDEGFEPATLRLKV